MHQAVRDAQGDSAFEENRAIRRVHAGSHRRGTQDPRPSGVRRGTRVPGRRRDHGDGQSGGEARGGQGEQEEGAAPKAAEIFPREKRRVQSGAGKINRRARRRDARQARQARRGRQGSGARAKG